MTERTDEDIDRLGESSRGAAGSVTALGAAADRVGTAFGGLIRGAPKTLSEFTDGVTRIIGVGGPVATAMKFAEGYIGVWQGLTQYGVNFGNELDEMIIKTGQANMRMEDLARVVQQSSIDLAGFGGSANQGLQEFLAAQGRFYASQERDYSGVQMRLMNLGLTTDDINERFLTFDMLTNIRNRRQILTDDQRNQQAAQFAEEMDRLARLTGKQADELAREQLELQRQGNIYAAQMLLPEATQGQLVDTITRMNAFGDTVGNVTTDILTRGFIDPNDPAALALQSFAPDLINTLYAARAAMQRGDRDEARRLEGIAAEQASAFRQNRDAAQLAVNAGATDISNGLKTIFTELNTSSEALSQGAILARLASENLEPTYENIARMRARVIEEERNAQLTPGAGNQMVQTYNELMMELQAVARTAQESTVRGFTGIFESAADDLSDAIQNVNWQQHIDSAFNAVFGAYAFATRGDDLASSLQRYQQVLADESARLEREGDTTGADLATRQAETANELLQRLNAGADPNEIRQEMMRLAETIRANNVTISARSVSVTSSAVQEALPAQPTTQQPQSIGTLGNFNRLFRDFGTESLVPLHGLEAVMTPEQVGSIMEQSAQGTLRGLANALANEVQPATNAIMERGFTAQTRTIGSNIDSMLNTLRRSIRTGTSTENTANVSEEVRTVVAEALTTMPRDMRRAFEEALGNTIKSPIEQLASMSNRSAEYQERIYKNTRGISGDLLRGA